MHVTGVMNFGGAETLMMNIVKKLHDKFNFIFLIIKAKGKQVKGDYDDQILALGAQIVYVDSMRSVGLRAFQKQLIETFKTLKPDVVHCHLNAKCGIISKCAYTAGVAKIISHCHAKITFTGNVIKRALYTAELNWQKTMINKYSTDFWGCSDGALECLFYKKIRKSEKCKKISNLIDAERFFYPNNEVVNEYKQAHNPKNKFSLGVVGRIAPIKNYLFALEIANELKKRNKDFVLFIVGLKQNLEYTQKLFSTINLYGLENYVTYLEPKKDVENVYAMMDVVLGTSISEGFSLTAVEAQLSGAYTILSNGYPREVNLEAGNCQHIDTFDVHEWCDKIETLMENKIITDKNTRKQALVNRGFDLNTEIEKISMEYSN